MCKQNMNLSIVFQIRSFGNQSQILWYFEMVHKLNCTIWDYQFKMCS